MKNQTNDARAFLRTNFFSKPTECPNTYLFEQYMYCFIDDTIQYGSVH